LKELPAEKRQELAKSSEPKQPRAPRTVKRVRRSKYVDTSSDEDSEDTSDEETSDEHTSDEDDDGEICQGCNSPDTNTSMLLCDGCNQGWHLCCLPTPMSEVPDGDWFCHLCAKSKEQTDSKASHTAMTTTTTTTAVLRYTGKVSSSAYLTARAKSVDGKTIREALAMTFTTASGKELPYQQKDLDYDIKAGRLVEATS
jgi:hypothetical protein